MAVLVCSGMEVVVTGLLRAGTFDAGVIRVPQCGVNALFRKVRGFPRVLRIVTGAQVFCRIRRSLPDPSKRHGFGGRDLSVLSCAVALQDFSSQICILLYPLNFREHWTAHFSAPTLRA